MQDSCDKNCDNIYIIRTTLDSVTIITEEQTNLGKFRERCNNEKIMSYQNDKVTNIL